MTTYGVTSSGFIRPRLIDIKTELENIIRATFGADTNVSAETVWGQLIGILSDRENLLWEGMEDTYNSQYPDTAFGASLDNVGAISGIPRLAAQASRVLAVSLVGTPGTLVPAGTQFAVLNSPTSVFATDNEATLDPSGDATVNVTATATGPIYANTGTLTQIVTPVAGLTSVNNTADAVLGRDLESDNDYRARRELELQIAGAGTIEAIRSGVLSLSGVTACIVFENITEVVDGDGRPPKSFEVVAQGGTTQDIIDKLWEIKPAGIRTFGGTSGTATDSMGQTHVLYFSRPTQIPIYVVIAINKNSRFPVNGVAVAQQNVVDAGTALGIGTEVVVNPYLMSSLAGIPGIDSLTFFIGTTPAPTTPNSIPMAIDEVPTFDSARVSVTAT